VGSSASGRRAGDDICSTRGTSAYRWRRYRDRSPLSIISAYTAHADSNALVSSGLTGTGWSWSVQHSSWT